MEMGEGFEGVQTKMSSKGREIILNRREGFLSLGDSMCEEHDQREPGIRIEFFTAGGRVGLKSVQVGGRS